MTEDELLNECFLDCEEEEGLSEDTVNEETISEDISEESNSAEN